MAENREAITLTSNGQKIFGILHTPAETGKRFPAVLMLHGFGGNKSGKFRLSVRQAEALSQAGIASFRFDFRGAGDSEGEFRDTTIDGLCADARIAMEWLQKNPAIDPARIAILGRSLGGALSVLTAVQFPKIKALALCAPVFDAKPWVDQLSNKNPEFEHQGVKLNPTFLKQFASLSTGEALLQLHHIPLLHVQSKSDKTIEQYHVENYRTIRAASSAETQFIELEHSDHDFSHQEEQESLLHHTTEWFKKYMTS